MSFQRAEPRFIEQYEVTNAHDNLFSDIHAKVFSPLQSEGYAISYYLLAVGLPSTYAGYNLAH